MCTPEEEFDIEANYFKIDTDEKRNPTFIRFMKRVNPDDPTRHRIVALFNFGQIIAALEEEASPAETLAPVTLWPDTVRRMMSTPRCDPR